MTRTRNDRFKRIIVIHPSDEMYGADKVLLEALRTVPADSTLEVWLPTDVDYPRRELSAALTDRGITFRHLPLAILRRAYLKPTKLPGLAWRFSKTAAALIRRRPHLVYVNTAAASAYLPVARIVGARAVLHLHEYISGGTRIVLPFIRFASKVVAVSKAIMRPLPGSVQAKTRVIYNGFDLPTPKPLPEFDAGIRCIVASRWNVWKGHDLLLEAWSSTTRSDLRLDVLGGPPPSGEAIDVLALIAESPHRDRMNIVGQTDDVRAVIDAAHVVIVPSTAPDPLPTIAIEALAAGRYVLGSDIGGMPEIVGGAGRLVPAGNACEWTRALSELTPEDVARATHIARQRFDSMFSRDRFQTEIKEELWT